MPPGRCSGSPCSGSLPGCCSTTSRPSWCGPSVSRKRGSCSSVRSPSTKRRETDMSYAIRSSVVAVVALIAAGCQTQQQVVDSMEPDAVHVAQRRGAFEMNCPAATASVLSKEMIQTPNVNPRFAPPQRAEYTVGVSGCGQRATYMVICAEGGTGCFAGGSRNTVRQ